MQKRQCRFIAAFGASFAAAALPSRRQKAAQVEIGGPSGLCRANYADFEYFRVAAQYLGSQNRKVFQNVFMLSNVVNNFYLSSLVVIIIERVRENFTTDSLSLSDTEP